MDKTVKILVLNNEIEASLLDGLLKEREIPHMIRSYHDSAYDGLWQYHTGWGQVDAPEEYREEILMIYNEMSEEIDLQQQAFSFCVKNTFSNP
jgi:hypothetical protein